jgi:hypothetical protein
MSSIKRKALLLVRKSRYSSSEISFTQGNVEISFPRGIVDVSRARQEASYYYVWQLEGVKGASRTSHE